VAEFDVRGLYRDAGYSSMHVYCTDALQMSEAETYARIHVLHRTTPDAIILDAMMPDVSGWDVLQAIRTRPETAETPVIICSVFNDPELAYALGASHFISKPVSRDQILTALRQLEVV
jgi:CheY-like chemotaxis protein